MRHFSAQYIGMQRLTNAGVAPNVLVCASLLLLAIPSFAADWLAPAADQTVTAPWVNEIATQLNREPYRDVFLNAVGYTPQSAIVRYLNSAAQALQVGNKVLAQSYVDRTIGIFDEGVRRGYFSQADVEPIQQLIRTKAEAAMTMKGERFATPTQAGSRWTGYTQQRQLGLTDAPSRIVSDHPEGK